MEASPEFPVAPAPFVGKCRQVDPGACFDWLRQGWALFSAYPGAWLGATVLGALIFLGLSIVPLVGTLAANLLFPILVAGMLYLCRQQVDGQAPAIGDLFIGFQRNSGGLVLVGVFYMLAMLLIGAIVAVIVGGGLFTGVAVGRLAGFGVAFGAFLLAAMLALVLLVPVLMAFWFAPALVFFNGMPPVDAIKASFSACAANWLPFMVYGLILLVLGFFAALPLGLGFLILVPVFCGALYASYRDVFPGT